MYSVTGSIQFKSRSLSASTGDECNLGVIRGRSARQNPTPSQNYVLNSPELEDGSSECSFENEEDQDFVFLLREILQELGKRISKWPLSQPNEALSQNELNASTTDRSEQTPTASSINRNESLSFNQEIENLFVIGPANKQTKTSVSAAYR
eukprot:gb/GECG01010721.1/.p1 GENE.gb/GECG01010721.1/~~gb/GECG01010721.1/.p1  ORF type:complete len:151 (+),score=14.37 gb/GECG01010721.1/:1-453(+)